MKAEAQERLWTAEEVADFLRIEAGTRATRYRAVRDLRVPFVRIGRRVRFDPGDVRRWVASQKEG